MTDPARMPPTVGQVYAYQEHAPRIDPSCYLAPGAMVLGQVTLAKDVSVWFNCVLRGDLAPIEIGEGSNIQDLTMIHIDGAEERPDGKGVGTVIGRNVTVGHSCTVHGCVVEDDALIGMGATVLSGAHIGRGAIVGAGALVRQGQQVPPYALVVGNPAQVKKVYTPEEAARLTEGAARIYRARIARFKAGLVPVPWP